MPPHEYMPTSDTDPMCSYPECELDENDAVHTVNAASPRAEDRLALGRSLVERARRSK